MRSAEVPQHGLTDEELNSLTDEERKAVENEDDAQPGDDNGDDDSPPEAAAAPATPPAAEAEQEPFAVAYEYDPTQFNEHKAREDLAALDKRFQEGEIDLDEYNKNRDDVRDQIQSHKIKLELSQEMNRQVAIAKWNAITETFMETPKNADFYANQSRLAALDAQVRRLAVAKNPDGTLVNGNKSESWILKEADRLVREAFTGTSAPAAPQKPDPMAGRRPPAAPQTLAEIPAAAPSDEADGEFAHLDSMLDGTPEGQRAFERAIAKLTPEQQARYAG